MCCMQWNMLGCPHTQPPLAPLKNQGLGMKSETLAEGLGLVSTLSAQGPLGKLD